MNELVNSRGAGLPIVQVAWVVDDLERAMSQWLKRGVGPFFTLDVDLPNVLYRGQPSSLIMSLAMAQAGPVQIELIQQIGEEPSVYTEGATCGAAGFHHLCRALGAYDETVATLRDEGIVIVTEARFGENGPRFCYADTRDTLGCYLEIADDSEVGRRMYAIVDDVGKTWNGQDPIRRLEPLLA
ncbi:Methylmalonyl-CoA epimerase [Sphingobium herbicidovorans NBRC 16415]|uniref:Methylmalonyl-CoA epimerase n=1 Tax=Sphingobium herbicidovorans (strain ATCC 700291 / DSM 11019 / CCUG 56400 / KCTC 2939 / LMG 18315 / NBRC 16415 / MH) TaxID=1219045 RepID=A0A086PBY0_SPHHM|nr:VOC family protein [Sphingobium herbicidovorans]KFG90898.1 Methylmalonyl-CoA epimerase [Sphingobium herbicidovorans NBRC 16415]